MGVCFFVCVCVFGGAVVGMMLRDRLPEDHRTTESRDLVRSAMGLVGTISALVLGLLVASAKNVYDTQSEELTKLSANVMFLDRVLAHYGPEAAPARARLKQNVAATADCLRSFETAPASSEGESLYDMVVELSPKDDVQR